jgi:MarR family transcriptional regulator, organic hydroperoxide resistance regulator
MSLPPQLELPDEHEPAGFVDNYLAFLLAKASHTISSGFHAQLKAMGISIATWRILAVLRDGPCSVGELADHVLLTQPTMSKTLDRLERSGYLQRTRDADNRRSVQVALNALGEEVVAGLIPLANAHEERAFAHLSPQQRQELGAMLRSTIAANPQVPVAQLDAAGEDDGT